MSVLSIGEIISAVAVFTILAAASFLTKNKKEEKKEALLHNPAYVMYEN